MNAKKNATARAAAVAAAVSLIIEAWAPMVRAQAQPAAAKPPGQAGQAQPTPSPTGAAKPAAAKASAATPAAKTAAPVDGGWPRAYNLPSGGNILVYQPQIASWEKQANLVAFSAVSYRAQGATKPTYGTIKLEAGTKVAIDDRLVNFQKMKIAEASFGSLPKEQVREIVTEI